MANLRINWAVVFIIVVTVVYVGLVVVGVLPNLAAEPGNWNDADPR